MGLIKQLIPSGLKFTPASAEINWTRVETLVHGPGASSDKSSVNSALFACLMAISNAYPEPPLSVKRRLAEGKTEAIPDHPLQQLLDRPTPNGELSIEELLFWTAWAKHTDGNAYWLKVRAGNPERGNVVELWPVSPTLIEPVSEGGEWISFYRYRIAPNNITKVPVGNIVHFRLGLDDQDMRKGLSPLKALARQMSTDEEADKFIDSLLKNYAVPGLVVIPTQGMSLTEPEADNLTNRLRRKFGGDSRGNIAVMSKETKIEQFGFSPKDLDMSILHRIPEERISAVLGVPAIVAGLGAGLDRATYANFKEAREMFTESKLIPQWRADARKIDLSLLPDFDSNPDVFVEHDLTNVRALQEDEDSKYTRLKTATGKPFMTRNEARTDIGLDPVKGWDDEDTSPPEPVPAQLQAPAQDGQQPQEPPADDNPAKTDLLRWQRKALKAVERGDPAAVAFGSDTIPPSLHAAILGQLEVIQSAAQVEAVFADAIIWGVYP